MSKIKITEVDLTTVEPNQNEGNDVVYIPGFSSLNSTSPTLNSFLVLSLGLNIS